MTRQEQEIALARAVVSIMRVAGADWDRLMQVLVARADRINDEFVMAPNEHVHRYQGRVQETRALLDEMARAPKLLEELAKQGKA